MLKSETNPNFKFRNELGIRPEAVSIIPDSGFEIAWDFGFRISNF